MDNVALSVVQSYSGIPNYSAIGKKEMFYLSTHSTHFTVIWFGTYGKGSFIYIERKIVIATTWITLFD